ncbi:MAG: hypothetical protein Q4B77_02125 [Coriobacteriaceae bacterium]|nr:hypothetical protein [Coriobacteriaceae bacterium]
MRIPLDSVVNAAKLGASIQGDAEAPVRVSVYVDASATPFLVNTVRDAFVPQGISAVVRVARVDAIPLVPKPDTDIALVLTCGGAYVQDRVLELVVAGIPTVVLAESSVEVPFITQDTRMLGLVAATDATHLLGSLARWILARTDKATSFAANFPFMRIAAVNKILSDAVVSNMATGALFFIPGADFPVMTLAQLGMMLRLAAVFGKPLRLDRVYDGAAVVAGALALRGVARVASRRFGRMGFVPKALIAGAGTYAMGRALCAWYERDVSYDRVNDMVRAGVRRGASLFTRPDAA